MRSHLSRTFSQLFSTARPLLLPSRRVLAYDTSYFALCQHLFSDFFRFFSKSIIGGVWQQRTLYIVGCAGGHVSRPCGKFGSVGVGAHCICARGQRRFPVGFPTTRLRYGRIFNPPLRVRCIFSVRPVGVDVPIDPSAQRP